MSAQPDNIDARLLALKDADGSTPVRPANLAPWPVLEPEALWGSAGEFVGIVGPQTEADPAALLLTFLVVFGNYVNLGPHAIADGARHPARLNAVIVGKTSRGRKGTSLAHVRRFARSVDERYEKVCLMSGLASGEGMIAAVRDTDPDDEDAKPRVDNRAVIVESEFVRVLKACNRENSTLSPTIRDAWDLDDLNVMTRKDPMKASGVHISILGHITLEELKRFMMSSDYASGFANRFLYVCSQRARSLAHGGEPDEAALDRLAAKVRIAVRKAEKADRLRFDADAWKLWETFYDSMDDDRDGVFGAVTARAEAQTLRLALTYALLDGETEFIRVPHLDAARAVWRYAEDSANHIWQGKMSDPVVDKLHAAILRAGSDGLTVAQQHDVFSRNLSSSQLEAARSVLEDAGRIVTETVTTGGPGRPRQVSRATKETKETEIPPGNGIDPFNSFNSSGGNDIRPVGIRFTDESLPNRVRAIELASSVLDFGTLDIAEGLSVGGTEREWRSFVMRATDEEVGTVLHRLSETSDAL